MLSYTLRLVSAQPCTKISRVGLEQREDLYQVRFPEDLEKFETQKNPLSQFAVFREWQFPNKQEVKL